MIKIAHNVYKVIGNKITITIRLWEFPPSHKHFLQEEKNRVLRDTTVIECK